MIANAVVYCARARSSCAARAGFAAGGPERALHTFASPVGAARPVGRARSFLATAVRACEAMEALARAARAVRAAARGVGAAAVGAAETAEAHARAVVGQEALVVAISGEWLARLAKRARVTRARGRRIADAATIANDTRVANLAVEAGEALEAEALPCVAVAPIRARGKTMTAICTARVCGRMVLRRIHVRVPRFADTIAGLVVAIAVSTSRFLLVHAIVDALLRAIASVPVLLAH